MIKKFQILTRQVQLQNSSRFAFSADFNRKPTKKDLDHYEVIVVGGNIGGMLTNHLDKAVKGKYKIMAIFENPKNQQHQMRVLYEQQRCSKNDYFINTKLGVNRNAAHTDYVGLKELLPKENKVVLKNGRKIGYDVLVIATGLEEDIGAIENFEDCWSDVNHPVFTNKDHSNWKSNHNKHPRFHYNFTHGDGYFCIPEYPFGGEVESYSFFLSKNIYNWYSAHGKLSPLHSFTIMNANEKFVQYLEEADSFIKDLLEKRQIKVEYGQKLIGLNKEKQEATFLNKNTGKNDVREYTNLYSLIPTQPNPILQSSGLSTKESNNLLDVYQDTLQHKKYRNIFGLGDVNNIPTTKTFWGGFHQIHVVRNNVEMFLKNKEINGIYDGYTSAPLHLNQASVTHVKHCYDNKPSFMNLSLTSGPLTYLNYLKWARSKKSFVNLYLFKNWGPPYIKFKKTFSELSKEKKEEMIEREKIYEMNKSPAKEDSKPLVKEDSKLSEKPALG